MRYLLALLLTPAYLISLQISVDQKTIDLGSSVEIQIDFEENAPSKSALHEALHIEGLDVDLDGEVQLLEEKSKQWRLRFSPLQSGSHAIYWRSKDRQSDVIELKVLAKDPGNFEVNAAEFYGFEAPSRVRLNSSAKDQLASEDTVLEEARRREKALDQRNIPWRLLLFLAALSTLFLLFRKRVQDLMERIQAKLFPLQSPSEKALKGLEDLRQKRLAEKGEFDAFYVEITSLVRVFIEEEHHIQAPEQSTPEFLAQLAQTTVFSEESKEDLKAFLNSADLVKFAQGASTVEHCQESLKLAQSLFD